MAHHETIAAMPSGERAGAVADIMARARALGLDGFGGSCFQAAVAINRTLFGGEGAYVAALNVFFQERGRSVGHMAVQHDGALWDADGVPKDEDDLESWGMLDPEDGAWAAAAAELGEAWDEGRACEAALFDFEGGEAEVVAEFGDDLVASMEAILRRAAAEWEAARQAAPGPR